MATAWVPKPGITPQEWKLRQALVEVRLARHTLDCRCGNYRRDGAPYCTMREYAACLELDKLIGEALCVVPSQAG